MSIALVHSPADVVRWLFVALGMGTDPTLSPLLAWPVFEDAEPSTPDNCITLYDTLGTDFGRTMIDGELLSHFGLQVRIRSVDKVTGWTKAQALRKSMSETIHWNSVTVGTSKYIVWNLNKIKQVLRLGRDSPATRRSLFTINCTVALTQVS